MYKSVVHGKGGIYAKVIAASIANGVPIYTLETCAPKFIDAEFEKHRMLSSNSSSSRAIPFKQLDEIYLPFDLRQNQKGMQGSKPLSIDNSRMFTNNLRNLYYVVSDHLWGWSNSVHKQHLNRYIEPWMFQKKVVTATEWDNFFKLRLHPDAQPEIQELARCMKEAMKLVVPTKLDPGQWHLPYVEHGGTLVMSCYLNKQDLYRDMIKCSVARCARVSYLNHDKSSPDIAKDLELADRLLENGHLTPFEHQATPMPDPEECWRIFSELDINSGITHVDKDWNYWSANFRGWIQNRQLI